MCGMKYSDHQTLGFAQKCHACHYTFYDGQKICVAVVIINNNQLLLTKRGIEPFLNKWDLPGGFVEPLETPEQASIREINEELGVNVKIDKLWFFNPCVPYVYAGRQQYNCDFVYIAKIISGDPVAADDVSEFKWFDLENLPDEDQLSFTTVKEVVKRLKKGTFEFST